MSTTLVAKITPASRQVLEKLQKIIGLGIDGLKASEDTEFLIFADTRDNTISLSLVELAFNPKDPEPFERKVKAAASLDCCH